MPIYKVQAPDGSIIKIEGPEGATDDQLIQAAAAAYQPKTDAAGVAGAITRGIAPVAGGAALGAALGAPFAGVGAVPGAIAGAGAGALTTLVGDPVVSTVNSLLGTRYKMPSEALGDLLSRVGVAQPDTEAERILQATAAGAAGAGGIASAGKALTQAASPVVRGVGAQLAAQPVQQIAGGAGAGLGAQSTQEAGGGALAQLGAGLAGGVAGAGLAGMRTAPRGTAQTPRLLKEAEQAGVKVMTSDVLPPQTFIGRGVQRTSESIPIAGTGGMRAAQQTQRVDAVRNLLTEFGADDAAKVTDNVMADLARKRSADLTKYSGLKNEVINRLDDAGAVPVNRAVQSIDDEIAKLQGLKTESVAPVIAKLEDFKQSIQGQGLRNIEELRKQLGESFKAPDLVSVRSKAEKATGSIYGALRQDMGDFIKSAGERRDVTKWSIANKRLSEMAGELDISALKSTLSRGDATPEVVNSMLFSKKPSELTALYRGLTPDGRANARVAILKKAADDAMTTGPGGEMVVSPDRFLNNVRKLDPSIRVFFKNDDLQRVEGLSRVLAATKRAGEAAASPPTGVQAVPFVAGSFLTDLLGGFGAATASAGTIGLGARALESAPVRDLLIKIPKAVKGSPEEAALVKRFIAAVQSAQTQEAK